MQINSRYRGSTKTCKVDVETEWFIRISYSELENSISFYVVHTRNRFIQSLFDGIGKRVTVNNNNQQKKKIIY